MRKIAILNFKGGTGKTTTAVNLSHALALRRQSVLVVDCDPQTSIAGWLGVDPKILFLICLPIELDCKNVKASLLKRSKNLTSMLICAII